MSEKTKFLKVQYTGIVELSDEVAGIDPDLESRLTRASVVLFRGLSVVLQGAVKVEGVSEAKYKLYTHFPKEKKARSQRKGKAHAR